MSFRVVAIAVGLAPVLTAFACPVTVSDAVPVRGRVELSDDPSLAGLEPRRLAPYVLYKSGACPTPGASTCMADEVATGFMMSDPARDFELQPLDELPAFPGEFERSTERAILNVQFTNEEHAAASWSYGLVMLAPDDQVNHDIGAAELERLPDSTPIALGIYVIETMNLADDVLAAKGLAPNDEYGNSLTWVRMAEDGSIEAIAPDDIMSFTVETLGAVRSRIVFPTLFEGESLKPITGLAETVE